MTGAPNGVFLVPDRPPPYANYVLSGHRGTVSAYAAVTIEGLLPPPNGPSPAAGRHPFAFVARALLRQAGRAAFDLRLRTRPGERPSVEVALVLRTWADASEAAVEQALRLREDVQRLLPEELETTAVVDSDQVTHLLDPYGEQPVQAAVVTKRELFARTTRGDSREPFHFAVSAFGSQPADWVPLYRALARSPLPTAVSLGLFPIQVPEQWFAELSHRADHYGWLGEELHLSGGLYIGTSRLGPDRFAAMAASGLRGDLASWSNGTAVARVQVTAPQLPVDVVELVGSALSSTRLHHRAEPAFEIRWMRGAEAGRMRAGTSWRWIATRLPDAQRSGSGWDGSVREICC